VPNRRQRGIPRRKNPVARKLSTGVPVAKRKPIYASHRVASGIAGAVGLRALSVMGSSLPTVGQDPSCGSCSSCCLLGSLFLDRHAVAPVFVGSGPSRLA
jgi:hypothetical protein